MRFNGVNFKVVYGYFKNQGGIVFGQIKNLGLLWYINYDHQIFIPIEISLITNSWIRWTYLVDYIRKSDCISPFSD